MVRTGDPAGTGKCEECGRGSVELLWSRPLAGDPEDRIGVRSKVCAGCFEDIENTAAKYGHR